MCKRTVKLLVFKRSFGTSFWLVNAFSNWLVTVRVVGNQRLLLLFILKSSKFYRKTPLLEFLFNKVAGWKVQLS